MAINNIELISVQDSLIIRALIKGDSKREASKLCNCTMPEVGNAINRMKKLETVPRALADYPKFGEEIENNLIALSKLQYALNLERRAAQGNFILFEQGLGVNL